MANRTREWQVYHDKVVEIASSKLRNNFTVYTNSGNQQLTRIGNSNLFPDIILTSRTDRNVQYIIEVETPESVASTEVIQWKQFSTLGGTFYLLVRKEGREKAENLCRTCGITSVKFASYWVNEQNILQLNYE